MKRVLVIGCAAPPVLQIGELIDRLESEGLSVSVVLTPRRREVDGSRRTI